MKNKFNNLFENLKFAFKKYVIKSYLLVFSLILGIASVVFVFVPLNSAYSKSIAISVLAGTVILTFILNFIILKKRNSIGIKINQTNVNIKYTDIFSHKFDGDTYKVIGVNDYFDTHLGDGVIDINTLHGKYLKTYDESCKDLDERILADKRLNETAFTESTPGRGYNKTKKYKLGSIFLDKKTNFILVALSRFDENNNAKLTTKELVDCYLRMWKEIAIVKESKSIALPLLGNSPNIQMDTALSAQEILETLLFTFKLSNVQIKLPSTLTIVIKKQLKKEINLQRIKEIYSGE